MPKGTRSVAAGSLPLAAFDSLTHSSSPPFRMRPARAGRMINTTPHPRWKMGGSGLSVRAGRTRAGKRGLRGVLGAMCLESPG
jgi:hypothetical protein